MVKKEINIKEIKGAEGIVIHNEKVVLGMQKKKRWYDLEDNKKAAIIKTLGGEIENEDKNSSKKALLREVLEEVKGIDKESIKIIENPIFTKEIRMKDLNIFEKESDLKMKADFYILYILGKRDIEPNDLPALVEIPINEFLKLEFNQKLQISELKKFVIKNKDFQEQLPEYYSFMIPEEIKKFLEKIREKERIER